MPVDVEVIELTQAQARELRRSFQKAERMYSERDGSKPLTNRLKILISELEEIELGEKEELRLGLGMQGSKRENIVNILEQEVDFESLKSDRGYKDGRELNALENGLEELDNPNIVEVEVE